MKNYGGPWANICDWEFMNESVKEKVLDSMRIEVRDGSKIMF